MQYVIISGLKARLAASDRHALGRSGTVPDVTVYRGSILNPVAPGKFEYREDGGLAVGRGGRIVRCGSFGSVHSRGSGTVDLRGGIIIPGLVDTHVHLPQYGMVAMDGYELIDWLNNYTFKFESTFENPRVAGARARHFFTALAENGTTAACVYSTVHEEATRRAFGWAERSGLRVWMGKVMMDRNSPDSLREGTAESLAASERLCREWDGTGGGRLRYVFTPRFAPTCSMELMKGAGRLAKKYGAFIQTHLGENLGEVAWVRELFPNAASYTDVYRQAGLLTERTVMAHCIHMGDGEIRMMKAGRSGVAHCPNSNFFLRSGIFDAGRIIGAGLKVGLGSDVGAGTVLSIFREMADACMMSKVRSMAGRGPGRVLAPADAFYLATLGGAAVLGAERDIGSLAPGKFADFVVLDRRYVDPMGTEMPRSGEELVSQIVYRGSRRAVAATYVAGEPVSRGR